MIRKRFNTKGRKLGFIASVLLGIQSKRKKLKIDDRLHGEFNTSTQQIGVNFSSKIRKVFRAKWLKYSKSTGY